MYRINIHTYTLISVILLQSVCYIETGAGYAMYVWTDSFDSSVSSCGESDFLAWNTSDSTCFTHSWNDEIKRNWLWSTCNVQGRKISRIFLSGVKSATEGAYNNNCSYPGVSLLKETLADGHRKVADLRIYALFADSDIDVSENEKVKYIVNYNDNCAVTADEKFDGVAVNNEAYAPIKCPDDAPDAARFAYLDKLQIIKSEALKQVTGTLLTHYSLSWHWSRCNNVNYEFEWNGLSKIVSHHMIDIFDSVDVQVGYITINAIKERLDFVGMEYSRQEGKEMYATLYLNKVDYCQTSFFPMTCDPVFGSHSEEGMWNIIDQFTDNGIEHANACLHYFRGVYSSGGNVDWPVHNTPASSGDSIQKKRQWCPRRK